MATSYRVKARLFLLPAALLAVFLLTSCAGNIPTATPTQAVALIATPAALPTATPTPSPRPASQAVHTSQDMKAQYERWPAEYKFAVDQDVVVLFAYPSPFIDWAGFAFINHIPSVSSVTLGKPVSIVRADGTVVPAWPDREETVFGERLIVWRSYNSEDGKARLEVILTDEVLMRRIIQGPAVSPTPTPVPQPTTIPASPITVAGTPPPSGPRGVAGPRSGPGPGPDIRIEWLAQKGSYLQGEPITLTGTIANVSNRTVVVESFPGTVSLDQVDTPSDEAIGVAVGTAPRSLAAGEKTTVTVEVPASLSDTLSPGRYTVHLAMQLDDMGGLGFGAGIVFVLLPPQGAMEKTVAVGEVRLVEGIEITLKWIEFTRTETKIVAVAVPPGYKPPEGPVSFPRGNMAGKNRIDGGPWQPLSAAYRDAQEGVQLEWTLGPVQADAETFEFAVTDFAINPSQQVTGLWEWTVSLGDSNTRTALPTPTPSQAADDIVPAPGLGTAYRGNIQQQGEVNPWSLIQSTEVELSDGANRARVTYRDRIDTEAGQTRNNIFRVYLPDVAPSDSTLPMMRLRLRGVGLPAGIAVTEGDEWHGPDPARHSVRILKIGISAEVKPGVYVVRIGVEINGVDYGAVLSEIRVLE